MTEYEQSLVPDVELVAVLIRDGAHAGSLVTRLPNDDGFRFDELELGSAATAERCVLIRLADAEVCEESGAELSTWENFLPANALIGVDLDDDGWALLGVEEGTEIDPRIGEVLWDSHYEVE